MDGPLPLGSDINTKYWKHTRVWRQTEARCTLWVIALVDLADGHLPLRKTSESEMVKSFESCTTINTAMDEDAPSFTPISTLFFSSKGQVNGWIWHFFTTKNDEDGSQGPPANMAYPINSYMMFSHDHLMVSHFSVREGGYGEKDLHRVATGNYTSVTLMKGRIYNADDLLTQKVEITSIILWMEN